MKPYKAKQRFLNAALGGVVTKDQEFGKNATTDNLFDCGLLVENDAALSPAQKSTKKTTKKTSKKTGGKSKDYQTKDLKAKPQKP